MPPSRTLEYPKTAVNKVNRYNVRGAGSGSEFLRFGKRIERLANWKHDVAWMNDLRLRSPCAVHKAEVERGLVEGLPTDILVFMTHVANYDLEAIHTIINTSTVLNISFNTPDPSNPFPVTLPMVGLAASFDHPSAGLGEPLDIYIHGYVSSRLMNVSRAAEGGESTTEHSGLPVTVSATKVDGLILTLSPYTHDINYRSATLYGYATVVTDAEEKLWAMEQITNSVLRDRWRHTRIPPDGAEMQSTSILKVKVVGGSGKIRVGGPRNELKDLNREELRDSIWEGVVPVYEHFGEPVPGKTNRVKEVPAHVVDFATEERERNAKYALDVITDTSQD